MKSPPRRPTHFNLSHELQPHLNHLFVRGFFPLGLPFDTFTSYITWDCTPLLDRLAFWVEEDIILIMRSQVESTRSPLGSKTTQKYDSKIHRSSTRALSPRRWATCCLANRRSAGRNPDTTPRQFFGADLTISRSHVEISVSPFCRVKTNGSSDPQHISVKALQPFDVLFLAEQDTKPDCGSS